MIMHCSNFIVQLQYQKKTEKEEIKMFEQSEHLTRFNCVFHDIAAALLAICNRIRKLYEN